MACASKDDGENAPKGTTNKRRFVIGGNRRHSYRTSWPPKSPVLLPTPWWCPIFMVRCLVRTPHVEQTRGRTPSLLGRVCLLIWSRLLFFGIRHNLRAVLERFLGVEGGFVGVIWDLEFPVRERRFRRTRRTSLTMTVNDLGDDTRPGGTSGGFGGVSRAVCLGNSRAGSRVSHHPGPDKGRAP